MKLLKLFVFALVLLPLAAFSQGAPKFAIDGGESVNTGNHMRGKEVIYEIKFKNDGDADLKITNVSTSCGCSTALASADLLKPGESGIIKFTYNGAGFGPVSKSVNVITNEAAGANTHSIAITMNMIDPVTIMPSSLISAGVVGEEVKLSATITNYFDKAIIINELTSNSPVVKITSDKQTIEVGETATLQILVKLYEESAVNAAAIVKTDAGEFQIPVLVDVKPKP